MLATTPTTGISLGEEGRSQFYKLLVQHPFRLAFSAIPLHGFHTPFRAYVSPLRRRILFVRCAHQSRETRNPSRRSRLPLQKKNRSLRMRARPSPHSLSPTLRSWATNLMLELSPIWFSLRHPQLDSLSTRHLQGDHLEFESTDRLIISGSRGESVLQIDDVSTPD